jgi:hypothetical protein
LTDFFEDDEFGEPSSRQTHDAEYWARLRTQRGVRKIMVIQTLVTLYLISLLLVPFYA